MKQKVGVLFVGLNGGVASTSIIAALAIAKGLSPRYGLYTETLMSPVIEGKLDRHHQIPIKDLLGLVDFDQMVFGGWDIEKKDLYSASKECRIVSGDIVHELQEELAAIESWPGIFSKEYIKNLDPSSTGTVDGSSLYDQAQHLRGHIKGFRAKHNLTSIIIINVASTEVYHEKTAIQATLKAFEEGLRSNDPSIGPAQVYAYASIAEGCPYANFTPSLAEEIAALRLLAHQTSTPTAGKDGKTGQTLIKTAVAPVFRLKNLHVDGWFSTNILGNKDGLVLDDPGSLKSKIVTKSSVLDQILGYSPYHKVNINYYPPRGDDKEAWDNIDFQGILGMPMQIKINFLCRDSILAAGNVLDLARLLEYCQRTGETGVQEQLSFFFKSPTTKELGTQPIHDFFKQEGILKEWFREKVYGVKYG